MYTEQKLKELVAVLMLEAKQRNDGRTSWLIVPKLLLVLVLAVPAFGIHYVGKAMSWIGSFLFLIIVWMAAKLPQ